MIEKKKYLLYNSYHGGVDNMYNDYYTDNVNIENEDHNNKNNSKIRKFCFIAITLLIILAIIALVIKLCSNNKKSDNNDVNVTVIIDKNNLSLEVGEQINLNAHVINTSEINPIIIWKSDDPEVVDVTDGGLITANKEGSTIIRASYGDIQAQCSVTVTPKSSEIQSLKIISGNIVLNKGQGILLQIEILPEKVKTEDLIFTSANNSIATVSEQGYINGINVGTTTITVKTTSGLSDSITVTITETVKNIEPNSLKINGISNELEVGKKAEILYEILPTNATNKNITWTSSNSSIATVNANGIVTGIKAGTCTITATTYNNIKASYIITVKDSKNETSNEYFTISSSYNNTKNIATLLVVAKSDIGLSKLKYCRFKYNSSKTTCNPDKEIAISNKNSFTTSLEFTNIDSSDRVCAVLYYKHGSDSLKKCVFLEKRSWELY